MQAKQHIQERRREIIEEMARMESMKRGTLNEQFFRVPRKGTKEAMLRGPYYVVSRNEHGKTVSERVPAADVERVREDIARYNRFVDLCREFAALTERLGSFAAEDALKKTPKSPLRRTRK
jgi:hypothetical protein